MYRVVERASTSSNVITKWTRASLVAGVVAGPLFAVVGLVQAFTRPGFDITRHALSVLENGDLGWLQISNFLLSGLLFVACAVGMRHAMRGSRGGTWGPLLIGVVGVGLVGAGCFTADPGLGFPPGTPDTAGTMSGHGLGHMVVSSLSFLALIAACFVFTRRFLAQHLRGWALYSVVSGVLCFVAYAGLATGHLWMTSAFVFTMLNGYMWVSVMAARLLTERPSA